MTAAPDVTPQTPLLRENIPPIIAAPTTPLTAPQVPLAPVPMTLQQTPPLDQQPTPQPRRSARNHVPNTLFFANKATFSPEGEELRHDKLMRGPDAAIWDDETVDDYDRLIERTHTMHFIPASDKPADRIASNFVLACYEKFKCGTRKRRVRGTHGGRTDYEDDTAAYVASVTTVKLLLNSVISTPGAQFATADISDFYYNTVLERPEYVKIRRNQIPLRIWAKYNLDTLACDNGNYVFARLDKTIPGLPQSGIIAQTALIHHLNQHGYTFHEGCLITHNTRPIAATLIVDDFGIKYSNEEDLEHLLTTLAAKYAITK